MAAVGATASDVSGLSITAVTATPGKASRAEPDRTGQSATPICSASASCRGLAKVPGLPLRPLDNCAKESRPQWPDGHGRLEGGRFLHYVDEPSQCPVAQLLRVVKKDIAQLAPLDGHQYYPVKDRLRRKDPLRTGLHDNCARLARRVADTAPQAELLVPHRPPPLLVALPLLGNLNGVNRACFGALTAPLTLGEIDLGDPVGGHNGIPNVEGLHRRDHAAAAATAVADVRHLVLYVFASLG